jgi:dTMP kinase
VSGLFITFEGPEGAGKTTQAQLLADQLRASGRQILLTREPGGTELGNRVRDLVLPASGLPISARAETLLYCAARAQLVDEVLRPALSRGRIAIVDRYADSTLAYQAYGRDLDPTGVRGVLDFATNGLCPDLTLLLDLPVDIGLARKQRQAADDTADWNRFEAEALAFHQRVREAYLDLAREQPERWCILDAREPPTSLAEKILTTVESRLAASRS